jgi:ADP-ribose pyrophosphatase
MTKPECIENKEVYKGKILTFFKKKMKFSNGNTSDWDFVHHNGAAAIVAVDDDGKLFLVKQYRPGCDRFTLEIPAGCLNPGEDRKTAAMRELEEEIGYHCDDAELLNKYYPASAYDDEYIEIYLAKGLTKTKQNLDPDEEVEVLKMDPEEIVNKILSAEISDGKTIAGVLTYYTKLKREVSSCRRHDISYTDR